MKQFIEYVLKDNKDIHKTNDFFEDTYELQFVDKFFFLKNGACVFLGTVFFLSLLAGKFTAFERGLLTE